VGPSEEAAPSAEGAAIARELHEELLAAVNELGENDRLVIGCRYFLELSEEETAAALGVRRGTVKSRTARALGRARGADVPRSDDGDLPSHVTRAPCSSLSMMASATSLVPTAVGSSRVGFMS